MEPARYRWVIVTATAAILAVAMGQLVNGLSAFVLPLEAAFGWSRGAIGLINSFGLAGLALGGAVMGFAADRLDIRKVALIGAVTTGTCLIAAGRANALWQLYAVFFLAGALGGGALFAPLMALVGGWFRTGAGLAIGIVAGGQAVGQGTMPALAALLIERLGWRETWTVMGIATLAALVPLALLIRRAPAAPVTVAAAARGAGELGATASVLVLGAATLFCCSLMSVPLMHLVPLIQGCGVPPGQAGSVMLVLLLAAIAGRIAFGWVADRIGAIPAWFAASSWQTALVFVFTRLDTLDQMLAFAPVYGFGYAGVMTGVLTTTRSVTPARSRSACTGLIMAFAWSGHALGAWAAGRLFDLTGSYDVAFAAAAGAGLVNLAIVGSLGLTLAGRRRTATAARAHPAPG